MNLLYWITILSMNCKDKALIGIYFSRSGFAQENCHDDTFI